MTQEEKLILNQVSDAFNNMPLEYRHIAINSETMVRIRDLQRLKDRVTNNYNREIKFINEAIKSYLKSIKL